MARRRAIRHSAAPSAVIDEEAFTVSSDEPIFVALEEVSYERFAGAMRWYATNLTADRAKAYFFEAVDAGVIRTHDWPINRLHSQPNSDFLAVGAMARIFSLGSGCIWPARVTGSFNSKVEFLLARAGWSRYVMPSAKYATSVESAESAEEPALEDGEGSSASKSLRIYSACVKQLDEQIDLASGIGFRAGEFTCLKLLQKLGARPLVASRLAGKYQALLMETVAVLKREDPQVIEAYRCYPRGAIEKFGGMIRDLLEELEIYADAEKARKRLRRAKRRGEKAKSRGIKTSETQTKKVRFKEVDDKTGFASRPPSEIPGSQAVVVWNAKRKQVGIYFPKTGQTLGVHRSSVINFDETRSLKKRAGKDAKQVLDRLTGGNLASLDKTLAAVKNTPRQLNGRLNPETVIVRVVK